MRYKELITAAKQQLSTSAHYAVVSPSQLFSHGAEWMHTHMSELSSDDTPFDTSIAYNTYGWLKYIISVACCIISAILLSNIHPALSILSILCFYLVEVHFLFLFPLLLDRVAHPIRSSIAATYKVGLASALINTVAIGCYMLIGLLNFKRPLHNWHIGCLAILIWYNNEVRGRI